MNTIILKFGGSSVADNEKLQIVAKKIIKKFEEENNIVVVVSAQGKMTDTLIKEAETLSLNPSKREMDALISVGEQITASKLAILLNYLGYEAISLTGWQAGIYTNNENQNAIIENIDITRINEELNKRKIVIISGFQGINENKDITTLGRGGSDTTAVALAAALQAEQCYIYSDVDGIYTADPNKVDNTRKLKNISYDEMISLSDEGAKVLHNRCVEIGEKYNVPIITESTFNNKAGTIINHNLESTGVKSIVKKDISRISVIGYGINSRDKILTKILDIADKNCLEIFNIDISRTKISVIFKDIVKDDILKEMDKEFQKNGLGEYKKNDEKIFEKVTSDGKIHMAIDNCKLMEKINENGQASQRNPMTQVYKVVEGLKEYLE